MIRVLLAIFTVCLQTAAAAEPLSQVEVETLGKRAETVVRGHVLHQRLEINQNGVWTIAMVRVTETLQGTEVLIREVKVPGGRIDDLEIMVARAPKLAPGDDVLLFLKGDRIVGMGEGAFVIDEDRIVRPLDAWTFIQAQPKSSAEASFTTLADVRSQLSLADASSARPSSVSN